jgi:hypothetical protein
MSQGKNHPLDPSDTCGISSQLLTFFDKLDL